MSPSRSYTVRRRLLASLLCVSLLLATSGCAKPVILRPATLLRPTPSTHGESWVLGKLRFDRNTFTLWGDRVDTGDLNMLNLLAAAFRDLLPETGAASRYIEEQDVPAAGIEERAFLIRVNVQSYEQSFDGVTVGSIFGMIAVALVIPIVFMGLWREHVIHNLDYEVALYEVTGQPITSIREPDSDELIRVYDLAPLTPILRHRGRISATVSEPLEDEPGSLPESFLSLLARDLMTRLLNDCLPRIRAAIGGSAPPRAHVDVAFELTSGSRAQ